MKKRIFLGIALTCTISLIICTALVTGMVFGDFRKDMENEIAAEAIYVAKAVENIDKSGNDYFKYLKSVANITENRITLVNSEGNVEFDSYKTTGELENHSDRPEIIDAVKNGVGFASRRSETYDKQTYYYAVRLENSSVVRIANTTDSVLDMMSDGIIWIALALIAIIIASSVVANKEAKSIISPLNSLNLDAPLENDTYDELAPFLHKLDKQSKKIAAQIDMIFEKKREIEYITDNIAESIVIFAADGKVLSINKSAQKLFNNKEKSTYMHLCRNDRYIIMIERALAGESTHEKIEINNKMYEFNANAVSDTSGLYGVFLFIEDITQEFKAESLRREFTANVSHELKTPLTSIMGFAEIIQGGIAKNEDVPVFAGKIHKEAHRLYTLIEDIIELSRLDEANEQIELEEVDLYDIASTVKDNILYKAEKKNIDVILNGSSHKILGNRAVLYEMVYNLCDNAVTYNNVDGWVKINVDVADEHICLSVEDNGIGIDKKHHERIFERFYRVDKSHSKLTGGTGLGLSIVKHAAQIHNAQIVLRSQVGVGTKIDVIF